MERQFIKDKDGNIQSVQIDYQTYKEIEPIIEDFLLGKMMTVQEDEEEYSISEAKMKVFEYIEMFYNTNRLHSSNNYMSPAEYERIKSN